MTRVVFAAITVALTAGPADAQPSHRYHWSLEARIAEADAVVIGRIADVHRNVLVAPGKRAKDDGSVYPDGQFEYAPAVRIGEVLKGDIKGVVDDLSFRWSPGQNRTYEQWQKAGNVMLWFLGPAPKPGKRRGWEVIVFGKEVPGEALYGGRREPPVFAMDFTELKDQAAVLARARQYAAPSKKMLPTGTIRFGGPWHDLIVPIEPATEPLAKRLIASPQDLPHDGKQLSPRERYQFRYSGVQLLSHFKSDANIALLKSLLDDPLEEFESSLVRQHPVRVKAFEVLLDWHVDTPLPKSPDDVTVILLAGAAVTDAQLQRVAQFRNLATLDLQDTKISGEGLRHLAGLRKLTRLELQPGQVTDACLHTLREIGLLHALTQVQGGGGNRLRSAADIQEILLMGSAITDAGLKELVGLKNLVSLDVRKTRVTDTGIAELQKALPECRVLR